MSTEHHDVLIVEDERELALATAEYLEASGLATHHCLTAEDALVLLSRVTVGVVLLDVNLPAMNGFAFCRAVRATADVPIIFVSARASDDDQILALSLGGDDYVTKPFSLAVLLAKVRRALTRGTPLTDSGDFDDGYLHVDEASGRTWLRGVELHLTTTEDRLLRHLVRHRGRVATKQDIIDDVWGEPFTSDGTLTVHIRRLRARLEPDPEHPRYIKTVWGRGYLFEDPS
ncbi:MAG TPA: DNA-binding response regulator [Propionibacteriaceae bacterium]|nr:response regulator transcription factor [Micropruina sp.]HBX81956.1 DNA-binding response regulator [Propionibacteriaceae bacterium]HBY22762.1 DNA-binding response regulator [Propionibacteriaceae bacterium]